MILAKLFLLFIIYSFIGWVIEMIYCYCRSKKIVNRGFLIGPICPIYGFGAILIYLLLKNFDSDLITIFLKTMLICGVLEYITSFILEIIFKTKWWDYSDRKFNINGRICLETLIPFGILGIIFIKLINPFFMNLVSNINKPFIIFFSSILFLTIIVDLLLSLAILFNIKNTINKISKNKNRTLKFTKKVMKALNKKSIFHKRIIKAFPNLTKTIRKLRRKIKNKVN